MQTTKIASLPMEIKMEICQYICIMSSNQQEITLEDVKKTQDSYSSVSIKNIDILPNRQYITITADSAQEQYS